MAHSTCSKCGAAILNDFSKDGSWYSLDEKWRAWNCTNGEEHEPVAEIPIWRMRWPWRPLSHEQRKTALAGVTWALVGWLVVPANEVRAVFGWDDHNSLPLMQRGLLALLFAWIVLHFRGKYLRAKEVAEAADRFTHSGSYDINNRGRAIYVSHLIEMVRLHRALDAWKGQVSSGSAELQRTLDAEQELAQRNSQG